jgi:TonB family protein
MACADASRKFLAVLLMLMLTASMAQGQPTTKDPPGVHTHVELEAKPPDEPTPVSSPEVEALPDAEPSTGALPPAAEPDQEPDKPASADTVAHRPEIETYVVPVYPPEARAKKIQGRVVLMVIVDTSGRVEDDIQVVDSIPMLDQAAIDAVHQWTFTPARDDGGNPVRVSLQVRVPFTLR